jgi:hypothetical protein
MKESLILTFELLWLAAMGLLVWRIVRLRRLGRGRVGPGAAGAVHGMLNEDRRNALEIIVEQRAEERDPERAADLKQPNP